MDSVKQNIEETSRQHKEIMMKRHSRKHIYEAIAYWKKQLRQLDENMHAGQDDAAMTLDDAIQHCYEVASRPTTC